MPSGPSSYPRSVARSVEQPLMVTAASSRATIARSRLTSARALEHDDPFPRMQHRFAELRVGVADRLDPLQLELVQEETVPQLRLSRAQELIQRRGHLVL